MGINYLPTMFQKQLEIVELLLQIRLLSYDEKRELERIKRNMKYSIYLNNSEEDFLQRIITKYGWLVK